MQATDITFLAILWRLPLKYLSNILNSNIKHKYSMPQNDLVSEFIRKKKSNAITKAIKYS
jgi:hypothetical protein